MIAANSLNTCTAELQRFTNRLIIIIKIQAIRNSSVLSQESSGI